MNDESAFQAWLDAHPDDFNCRLVFADWLQERGDERAEGYRALGLLMLSPRKSDRAVWYWYARWPRTVWYWYARWPRTNIVHRKTPGDVNHLPGDWWDAMLSKQAGFGSRRAAEDATALAFAKLPPERRAALLAAPTIYGVTQTNVTTP
jgi:uncharacterized protein (TIGR02996 family)